ncbi:hypothetical protein GSI_09811 [Ganoderma sinense ZZ0214-1]|uniref:Uncharacterized protein n=1 Tax=Ganoderma sinense ZZ0214-1 TaxID=1077348 RepID=A0A2G8S2R0_9APHY|nr:hypothetical protein GSI_09811 [Ganoderma sinense ZZ0214-1]
MFGYSGWHRARLSRSYPAFFLLPSSRRALACTCGWRAAPSHRCPPHIISLHHNRSILYIPQTRVVAMRIPVAAFALFAALSGSAGASLSKASAEPVPAAPEPQYLATRDYTNAEVQRRDNPSIAILSVTTNGWRGRQDVAARKGPGVGSKILGSEAQFVLEILASKFYFH